MKGVGDAHYEKRGLFEKQAENREPETRKAPIRKQWVSGYLGHPVFNKNKKPPM